MNLKNIFKSAAMVVAGISMAGLSSCSYLDVIPPEQPTLDDAMKTYDRARGFLYSCYAGTTSSSDLPVYYLNETSATTDEYFHPYTWCDDNAVLKGILVNTASSTSNMSWWWGTAYKYVGQCLLFERKLEEIGRQYKVAEPEEMDMWLAETRFLKAYYHFTVLRKYGPIPITRELIPMDSGSGAFPGRSHYDYCVAYICHELDEAAKQLPAQRPDNELGRATSTICKALKARILLYAASPLWNGEFPFPAWRNKVNTPADEELGTPDYGNLLFSLDYDRNKWQKALDASLEALALAEGEGGRELYRDTTYYKNQGVELPYVPGEVTDEFKRYVMLMRNLSVTRENEGNRETIFSSSGDKGLRDRTIIARLPHKIIKKTDGTYPETWSGTGPSLYTVWHFLTDNGMIPENDPDYYPEDEWYTKAGFTRTRADIIKLNVRREPRFYAWMAFDGGDYGTRLYDNTRALTLNMKKSTAQGYAPNDYNRDFTPSGYLTQKYVHPLHYYAANGNQNNYNTAPEQFIRLAELYLNIAECYAELDNDDEALRYMNVIRERAGAKPLTAAMAAQSGMSVRDWVRNERFIEFWNEGLRFFDLRRWKLGNERLGFGTRFVMNGANIKDPSFDEFNQPVALDFPYSWADRQYLAPVFYNEVSKNPQLVQAPGY